MKKILLSRSCWVLCIVFFAGCSTQQIQSEAPVEPEKQEVNVVEAVQKTLLVPELKKEVKSKVVEKETAVVNVEVVEEEQLEVLPPSKEESIVYFNFDSSELSEHAKSIISTHIDFLRGNPNLSLTLEGHADMRGSDEYNNFLASQRVKAIKSLMLSEQVNEHQINLQSFGERRPAVEGEGFDVWRSNRRAMFVYHRLSDEKADKLLVFDE